jgi:ABC-type Mn2+/Zn2+ transport system permease subunit/Mn-dependent DtxR family transcriptional regulator
MTDSILSLVLDPVIDYAFMRYGLAVVVVVGITSSVLSCLLVVRRQALMGDAISHSILLGVVLGWMVGQHAGIFWGALASGILSGVAITFVERNSRVKLDAAMGVFFTFAFALGLAIISVLRPTGIDLFHVLLGNVLGVGPDELILTSVCGGLVLATVFIFFKGFHLWSFDPQMARASGMPTGLLHYLFTALLSATIVAALQAVGLILVIAMLVTPGATAYLLSNRLAAMMAIAAAIGLMSGVGGLYGSYYLDVASGPAMVIVASVVFVAAFLFAPQQGVIARARAQARQRRASLDEDVLRTSAVLVREHGKRVDAGVLSERLAISERAVRAALLRLWWRGLLSRGPEGVTLTAKGTEKAVDLIHRHRVIESYLYAVEGYEIADLHAAAQSLEHDIGPDAIRYMERRTDHAAFDPHGHRIPADDRDLRPIVARPLTELPAGVSGRISMLDDDRNDILPDLLKGGFMPKALLRVVGVSEGGIKVEIGGRAVELSVAQAQRIFVTPLPVAGTS